MKKTVKLTESDLHNIIKEAIKSVSYEKKKIIRQIYKVTNDLTSKIHSDDNWEAVKKVWERIESIIDGELEVTVNNGGYSERIDKFPNYKQYDFKIKLNNDIEIQGELKCHAAGTIEYPFDRYDITITMW
jgi:hypothetical protein